MSDSADSGVGAILLVGLALWGLHSCQKQQKVSEFADQTGASTEVASSYLSSSDGNVDDAIDYYQSDRRDEFDEDAAKEKAEEDLASEGYDGSYGCTSDCSGHQAGWNWRAEHGNSTYGKSQSFAEGGQAFDEAVEERVDEMRDEYEEGEQPY